MPPAIGHYLKGWAQLPPFARLRGEHLAIEENKRIWGSGPFVTVDAVVTAAEHVLLVERGQAPGKGLWALPGGFLEPRERVLQGAIRELREETGLALLDSTLEAALTKSPSSTPRPQPARSHQPSPRFELVKRLPEVAGADDAALANGAGGRIPAMEGLFFEAISIPRPLLALAN